jgi:DNA-binding NarL/FixJ family response regulator
MIRVLLVDGHPEVRDGLSGLLSEEPDLRVVGAVRGADQGLREAALQSPDVVVIDVRPQDDSGIDLCGNLVKRFPGLRVLVLASSSDVDTMLAAFSAGARGFMLKESAASAFRWAIRVVADSGTFVDPKVAAKLVSVAAAERHLSAPHGVSPHEMRVLRYLPRGYTNRQIAEKLGISEQTVKTHVRRGLRKLGVSDRVQAAALLRREGLV